MNAPACTTRLRLALLMMAMLIISACDGPINSPYPSSQAKEAIFYARYVEPPKHFDPVISYSEDQYRFLRLIYEQPVQFHYLKRPYELVPMTAESVPTPVYYDAAGNVLPGDPDAADVARAVYEVQLQKGILYQPHPCFAKAEDGSLYYGDITLDDLESIYDIDDFEHTGTRELVAEDYITQMKRMCDRRLDCPIYSTLKNYIAGMEDCRAAIDARVQAIRDDRAAEAARAGVEYNRLLDERRNPIVVDYEAIPFAGVKSIDTHTYQIVLIQKYPQMRYWLAMPFFSPIPQEAVDFYTQQPLTQIGITLDRYPVGTGPYRFQHYIPNREAVLVKNENYRFVPYPDEGEPGDKEKGLLADAGEALPLTPKIVFKLEKESLPSWNKFLQGYYDQQIIGEETFDQAISVSVQGQRLTPHMEAKGIAMDTQIRTSIRYLAFNMKDPVWGGYTEETRKLRQAVSIAANNEEWISIFENGNGVPAHGPIPPGVYGGVDTTETANPYVYNWDEAAGEPVRKSLDEASRLLTEAGYQNGVGPDGKPLRLVFLNSFTTARHRIKIPWLEERLRRIGIQLVNDTNDYSTFQDKAMHGNFQMIYWGWNADYPDPENFMFLFYGPNGKVDHGGENTANYDSPEFDELFQQMKAMNDSPKRQVIIDRMTEMVQRDAPWVFIYHEAQYDLTHSWVSNYKPHLLAKYPYQYLRVDPLDRAEKRAAWNEPVFWPVLVAMVVLVLLAWPAVRVVTRNQ